MVNMVGYGMTKAAGLIATTKFALKLKDEGFIVITLSPGMVDCSATAGADSALCVVSTGFCMLSGGLLGEALAQSLKGFASSIKSDTGIQVIPQTPEASVGAQLKIIDGLDASDNGLFLAHTGGEYRHLS